MSIRSTLTKNAIGLVTLAACVLLLLVPADDRMIADDSVNLDAVERRHNPGHYVSLRRKDDRSTIAELALPGVTGVQRRYYWKTLEPSKGEYDFSAIRADLAETGKHGLQLVVFVEDKTFNGEMPTPDYLRKKYTLKNRNGGYTVWRWDSYVQARFIALLTAIGAEFDGEPGFEGMAIQETSLSLEDDVLRAHDYSPEKYRDNLAAVLLAAADAAPHSNVFWYQNYLPKNQKYLASIAELVYDRGVIIGGPDVLPDNPSLTRMVYPLYQKMAGRATMFNSLQYDSYGHERADGKEKYWSLEDLYMYARDELHVEYLMWNHKTWRKPKDSFDFEDAKAVIARTADFGDG